MWIGSLNGGEGLALLQARAVDTVQTAMTRVERCDAAAGLALETAEAVAAAAVAQVPPYPASSLVLAARSHWASKTDETRFSLGVPLERFFTSVAHSALISLAYSVSLFL
jgi:hypothetical protein